MLKHPTESSFPPWLPPIVPSSSVNWEKHLNLLFRYFKKEFIDSKPEFRELNVLLKKFPDQTDTFHPTFWHIISEGVDEINRIPEISRCERIRWPRPIIEHENEPNMLVWENVRRGNKSVCIDFEEIEYLVVLGKRKGYLILTTAYPIDSNHSKYKLLKEYKAYQQESHIKS